MEAIIVLVLTGMTSVTAYRLGRWYRWPRLGLRVAIAEVVECLGIALLFLMINIGLGIAAILLLRQLPLPFVSVYVLDDVSLVVISAVQGTILYHWGRVAKQ